MDSDTEFPMPSYREREAITRYLEIEHEFIAATDFYTTASNLQYRRHAVSTIARLWHAEVLDVYIPYLAMNYFDRFASTNPLTKDKKVNFKPDRIMRMEYRILSGLDWRMRSITPFYFLTTIILSSKESVVSNAVASMRS
ncbi:hypothetical protein E2542_SST26460 [Spatholobus suberectus]|nr:hypothetical protein E2542_SST26460 [Spatholobus suberectus]